MIGTFECRLCYSCDCGCSGFHVDGPLGLVLRPSPAAERKPTSLFAAKPVPMSGTYAAVVVDFPYQRDGRPGPCERRNMREVAQRESDQQEHLPSPRQGTKSCEGAVREERRLHTTGVQRMER